MAKQPTSDVLVGGFEGKEGEAVQTIPKEAVEALTEGLPIEIPPEEETEPEEDSDLYFNELSKIVQPHSGKFNPDIARILVYGDSGSGKTRFASTFKNPVFLDIDKGMASVTENVHRIQINTWTDAQEAFVLFKHYRERLPFDTVVVDSLNELQYIAMRNVIEAFPTVRRPYEDLASQSDYGKMLDDFDRFIRAFKTLDMAVVFIANVANREYETDPVQPRFTGKNTAGNVMRMMDIVGYLYKLESAEIHKPRAMVFDAVNHVTKDRSGKLPSVVENPDYRKLYDLWTR